jgi:hypothetical protein
MNIINYDHHIFIVQAIAYNSNNRNYDKKSFVTPARIKHSFLIEAKPQD